MRNVNYLILVFVSFLIISCVEEYWPEIKAEHNSLLVVSGKITNDARPYTIILSKSSSVTSSNSSDEFHPLADAIVQIADDNGNSETLTEVEPGIYKTAENGIQGTLGRSYKIIVKTKEGGNYESAFEELIAPVGVESVTVQEETHFSEEIGEKYSEGFQFYVTTAMATNSKNYFCWELEETYEYHAPGEIFWTFSNRDGFRKFKGNRDTLRFCWSTNTNTPRFANSTDYLNEAKIENSSLHFIPFNDERVKFGYSLLVKQLTINEKTYAYLNSLLGQDASNEGLYVNQPYQIRGNIINIENPDELVLGWFMVASVVEASRVFVKAPSDAILYEDPCAVMPFADVYTSIFYRKYNDRTPLNPAYLTEYEDAEYGHVMGFTTGCIDCTKKGGSAKKPDYWEK